MPITPFLDGHTFDSEAKRVMGVAFEMAHAAQRDWDNYYDGFLAKRIIQLAEAGERNPDLLCERALKALRRW